MPLGRAGSIPAQRTKKTAIRRFFCFNEVLEGNSAGFSLFFLGAEFKWGVQRAEQFRSWKAWEWERLQPQQMMMGVQQLICIMWSPDNVLK